MRKYESIILEAELLALPAESVRARLIQFASKATRYDLDFTLDSDAEEALRLRRDPLIDLSLAQYARYIDTVKPIFHNSSPGSALRIAVLANQNLSNAFMCYFPSELFEEVEDMIEWLINAETIELNALFQNPKLSDRFLRDLLELRNEFERVPDARLSMIVGVLANNPRMSAKRESTFMDGGAEFDYNSVFDAAWTLAERVEPTKEWASALSWLYTNLPLECFSIKKPLEVAMRWHPHTANAEFVAKKLVKTSSAFLSEYEMIRMGLARLATEHNDKLLRELLTHEDRALRAAAYTDYELTPSQLDAACEKDGELAFRTALNNMFLWRTDDRREMLRSLAWKVNQADNSDYLDAPNQFNGYSERMEKKHPDWFKEEPDADDNELGDDKTAVTKHDLADVALLLTHQKSGDLAAMGKRVDWIFWLTGFTAAFVAFKLW